LFAGGEYIGQLWLSLDSADNGAVIAGLLTRWLHDPVELVATRVVRNGA
jgi:aquaporin Z